MKKFFFALVIFCNLSLVMSIQGICADSEGDTANREPCVNPKCMGNMIGYSTMCAFTTKYQDGPLYNEPMEEGRLDCRILPFFGCGAGSLGLCGSLFLLHGVVDPALLGLFSFCGIMSVSALTPCLCGLSGILCLYCAESLDKYEVSNAARDILEKDEMPCSLPSCSCQCTPGSDSVIIKFLKNACTPCCGPSYEPGEKEPLLRT